MTWADKLIEKVLHSDLLFRTYKTTKPKYDSWREGKRRRVVLFDDLVLAVLEKNKEIEQAVERGYPFKEKEQALAFSELVEACEKVKQ